MEYDLGLRDIQCVLFAGPTKRTKRGYWSSPWSVVLMTLGSEPSNTFPCHWFLRVVCTWLSIRADLACNLLGNEVVNSHYLLVLLGPSKWNIHETSVYSCYHPVPVDVTQVPIRPNHCLLAGSRFRRWHLDTGPNMLRRLQPKF